MDFDLDYLPPTAGDVEGAYATRAEAFAAVPTGRCFLRRLDGNGVALVYIENGAFSRSDGPAAIAFDLDGKPEITGYFRDGEMHRVRAPAHFRHDPLTGAEVGPWEYFRRGKHHRISGPAKTLLGPSGSYFGLASAGFDFDEWWCDGVQYEGRAAFFAALAEAGDDEITAAFMETEFDSLTYSAIDLRAAVDAIAGGVRTPTGVHEVLAGTPVDWVVSFEAGEVLGFATAGSTR